VFSLFSTAYSPLSHPRHCGSSSSTGLRL
jgi:hypothetical protein